MLYSKYVFGCFCIYLPAHVCTSVSVYHFVSTYLCVDARVEEGLMCAQNAMRCNLILLETERGAIRPDGK